MLKKLKKKGLVSIVEVIVTSVIFIIASFGIFSSLSMVRPHGTNISKRLDAAYTGKKFIENLRNNINIYANATIYTNNVSPYTISWYVLEDGAGVRQLFMNIDY